VRRFAALATAAAIGLAACSDSTGPTVDEPSPSPDLSIGSSSTVKVVNSDDAGPGSFRDAVEKANGNSRIQRIEFARWVGTISLATPVVFTGTQNLELHGSGATLDGSALAPGAQAAFAAIGGGDLSVTALGVRNAPGEGLAVEVPGGSTGIKKVTLIGLQITGNQGHGVLINDQENPLDPSNPNGSAASLRVLVVGCRFERNGFGDLDKDGLRVNEGGIGDLDFTISLSRADGNGADGIELDERAAGDAKFMVSGTHITGNGSFDPTLADLDDGMDVDESDEGNLIGKVLLSSANENKEEGFDFNENHAGDFRVDMVLVEATGNLEEGIDFEEDDDFQGGGDLITTLIGIKANRNGPGGDAGLKIRERGDGNLNAKVLGAETSDNAIGGINIREQQTGDLTAQIERGTATANGLGGISVREDDDGSLSANLKETTVDGNTGHGIDFDENSTGDLTATVARLSSSNNSGAGVRGDQQLAGAGTLHLANVALVGNGGGAIVTNPGVVVTQTP
jgi:hypothetical protein